MVFILSIVLPAYNESANVCRIYECLSEVLTAADIEYELVYVNDGSSDDTWKLIVELSKKDVHVTGVCFSRNFGKEAAILAGLTQSSGSAAVVMDSDLQHPPEVVVEMYKLWQEGYEVVEGIKRSRGKEGVVYRLSAGLFYKMMTKAMQIDMQQASDFKLLDAKVVKHILDMPERNTFFRALSSWVGFNKTFVEFDVKKRVEGETKWSKSTLIKYAIRNITAFSAIPLQMVTVSGICVFFAALALGIQTFIKYLMGRAVEGFTTVILLLLLIGSAIMISLGIIGYYLSKIYDEVKRRPTYIVSEVVK